MPDAALALYKRHHSGCRNKGSERTDCDCAWRGKLKNHDVDLAEWTGEALDPRKKRPARTALTKLWIADYRGFSPLGYEHSLSIHDLIEKPHLGYWLHPAHRQKFLRYAAELLASSQAVLDIIHRYEREPVHLSFYRKPLSLLRRIVRADKGDGLDLADAASVSRHASERALRRHLADLVTDGLLVQDRPDHWRATELGKRFQQTSRGLIKRATADAALEGFMVRLREVNADDSLPIRVPCAVLFGSYLSDLPAVGDIDVAISLVARHEVLYSPLEGVVFPGASEIREIRSRLRGRSRIDLRSVSELESVIAESAAKGVVVATRVLFGEWKPPAPPKPPRSVGRKTQPKRRLKLLQGAKKETR